MEWVTIVDEFTAIREYPYLGDLPSISDAILEN
jgi:hypothetical protein